MLLLCADLQSLCFVLPALLTVNCVELLKLLPLVSCTCCASFALVVDLFVFPHIYSNEKNSLDLIWQGKSSRQIKGSVAEGVTVTIS